MKDGRFGIVGWPVSGSLSPVLHAFLYDRLGLRAEYEALAVEPGDLGDRLRSCLQEGYTGLNVTMPHKESCLDHVRSGPDGAAIGAANTLVRRDSEWEAHNTDGAGLIEALRHEGFVPTEKRILILGAGGAARAAAWALGQAGARLVRVANRTPERAEEVAALAERAGAARGGAVFLDKATGDGATFDLVLQATPLGMGGDDRLPIGEEALRRAGRPLCLDMIYHPAETPFLAMARELGCQGVNGLGMLVFQARIALELWLDQPIDLTDHLKPLFTHLQAHLASS